MRAERSHLAITWLDSGTCASGHCPLTFASLALDAGAVLDLWSETESVIADLNHEASSDLHRHLASSAASASPPSRYEELTERFEAMELSFLDDEMPRTETEGLTCIKEGCLEGIAFYWRMQVTVYHLPGPDSCN